MENAIKVAKQNGYTFRIITIEGDVINPSGAITGGSVAKENCKYLRQRKRNRKTSKDIQNLKNKIEKQENEKRRISKFNRKYF